ncbi:MAG TPA: sigma-54 dependent transcriptional regulator [Candidatus Krumholzibacteria bacterium]|nr:sigma-54 dependent transcriptional regulator [Candidatus Krumholzibacteria bacterium]HPD71602.1 sigma-54 dependent transcriptional regulator [Candidatus Krumholzibacteria bacterium]HRY41465.1 sigma-54 dependent transcriptional regulator [Candidatus Krumholzibacteria bacterium]
MADRNLILLSRQTALYAAVAGWRLPDTEVYAFADAATAVSRAAAGAALVVFDTRGFPAARATLNRLLSLGGDTDLVVLGPREDLGGADLQPPPGSLRFLPPDVPVPELQSVVELLLRGREVRRESGIVGRSRAVGQMIALIAQTAPLDVSVLITGESGTGKELVARAIHRNSPRRDGPFLGLNCGALGEGVLESELFGHVRGAFTGAVAAHDGVFKRADHGTLFLDEVGEMPLGMQTRFLRALETGEFTPVGGKGILRSDIRLVAATNRDLLRDVESGRFRQDLYYRLRVIVIETPPLRERPEDILVLADHFLQEENREHGLAVRGFSRLAKQALRQHSWPGNIRELRNVVRAAVVLKQRGLIEVEDLPADLGPRNLTASQYLPVVVDAGRGDRLDFGVLASTMLELRQDIKEIRRRLEEISEQGGNLRSPFGAAIPADGHVVETLLHERGLEVPEGGGDLQAAEKALIAAALDATGGNRRRAAGRLGISERTLYRKLKHYGLG